MADDLVTIGNGTLTARINPLGAELWSLRDAQGREFMTAADPAFWAGHAPVLFPIVGGLAGGVFRQKGREWPLDRHGFARRSRFALVEQGADAVRFRLEPDAAIRAVWPFEFALELAYRLTGATLDITASVANTGAEPMPFSLGFHPAFAWPLPGGAAKADHCVTFDQPEPGPVRRLDAAGLMLPDTLPTPVQGRELAPTLTLFEADALIWNHLASRALTFGAPGGAALALTFPDTPMLGIWQKPGADFLCLEPWAGHADPQGFAGDLAEKPGTMVLEPGAVRDFRLGVTILAET